MLCFWVSYYYVENCDKVHIILLMEKDKPPNMYTYYEPSHWRRPNRETAEVLFEAKSRNGSTPPSKHFSEDDIVHTALKWAIADKVILGKEISTSVKCFQKNTKQWARWEWLAGDRWWWWFFKISGTRRKERLPNECSVVKRVKKLSQKAKKQRRKLYMYMCMCK